MTERGWMPGVTVVKTMAFGYTTIEPGTMQARGVMSHIMQGYQRTMVQWAQERPPQAMKSAHFSISRKGEVIQHVSIFDPCWAAGGARGATWIEYDGTNPNWYTVSIEHEGFAIRPNYGYDYVYADIRPWPAAMVEASIRVQRWVLEQHGLTATTDTIIGHYMTDQLYRKHDPGPQWPRDEIIAALQEPQAPAPDIESVKELLQRVQDLLG